MSAASPRKPCAPSARELPVTPQRRILSLSSTNHNKGGPARAMTQSSASSTGVGGARKTSWGKRLGGMLSGLTSSASNKENDSGSMTSAKSQASDGPATERDVVRLGIPVRGRSVSARTK